MIPFSWREFATGAAMRGDALNALRRGVRWLRISRLTRSP
jgi:hypothetical protein